MWVCLFSIDLVLEYFEEDSPDTEEIYITNKTLNLPINTRNVWIRPLSSRPDPFTNVIPVWFFNKEVLQEMQNPHGVETHEQNLKFLRILESREQEGNYTLKVGSFSVSFHLVVGKHCMQISYIILYIVNIPCEV